jgi:hypothetical protein
MYKTIHTPTTHCYALIHNHALFNSISTFVSKAFEEREGMNFHLLKTLGIDPMACALDSFNGAGGGAGAGREGHNNVTRSSSSNESILKPAINGRSQIRLVGHTRDVDDDIGDGSDSDDNDSTAYGNY